MPAAVEVLIVGMRREHPGWGPSRIVWELERAAVVPLPGRSAVYRALVRHGLVQARKRRRRREDYRRWERPRAMDLWQMDVMGRVFLAGGAEVKIVTGIDDHSRFVVSAKAVMRATARPVCQRWPRRCAGTAFPSRSSRTTARSSPRGSAAGRARSCSTGSALITGSSTC
jgi:hypothetical protein